jgi:quercetin dioxygenase-like cupin family protein
MILAIIADHYLILAMLFMQLRGKPDNRYQRIKKMKHLNLYAENDFSEKAFKKLLVHDSPYFKIINFNFKAGQELPVHSHDIEGQLSLVIIEGEGDFLGKDGAAMPAKTGDVVISDIAEPHGLRAKTDLRLLVTIAPPI